MSLTPNPMVMAGALTQRVKNAKIALLGATIPILNPVRVAEEFAMLDTLTSGRVIAGKGAVRHLEIRHAVGLDLVGGLAEGQRFGLREEVGYQQIVMLADGVERAAKADEVARDQLGALVD